MALPFELAIVSNSRGTIPLEAKENRVCVLVHEQIDC